jgi:predicted dinucleotide-binding enzyme
MGSALAHGWIAEGHDVTLGVRDQRVERNLPAGVRRDQVALIADAIEGAEVVVVAIPGSAVEEVVTVVRNGLEGKIVIDASNNLQAPVRNSLAAIELAAPSSRRFRAFNSLPAATVRNPFVGGRRADLFYAGPSDADGSVVELLIRDAGLNPIRVGGLEWAPVIDALGGLFFALGRTRPDQRLALALTAE